MNTDSPKPTPTVSASANNGDRLPHVAAAGSAGEKTTIGVSDSSISPAIRPTIVGRYEILDEGQVGGMGIVYKARDVELDRIVALKAIKGGVLATEEEVARFYREARAAARLNHPNIVAVHEIGQAYGCPYFTMAFASGGSLSQQRERFADPRLAAALLETIARAVHHAHQRGILHRDLKPGNILFDERGIPLVSDFGLAKFLDASLDLTRTGAVLGTPSYMAPEQARGQMEQVSAATDVWALGIILYELLTGRQPFKGGSHEEQLRKVQTTEPLRPRSVQRRLDRALETVVLKCLEKEPSRRYISAEALADDLARWLHGEPVTAQPPSRLIRAWRAVRRYRTAAVRVVFAVSLLALLALVWRSISPSVPPSEAGERLAPEAKTILLGASGPPPWYRWSLCRGLGSRMELDKKGVFHIQAAELHPSMLELLPSAPKRYRLRAQIQHISSQSQQGKVGLYFAHAKHPAEEGTAHFFFQVSFNDRVPKLTPRDERTPPTSQAVLTLSIYCENKQANALARQNEIATSIAQFFTPSGEVEPMPWRTLEVEVTPEWITTRWEEKPISTRSPEGVETDKIDPKKVLERITLRRLAGLPSDATEPSLGEGIGLFVEKGVAAFRSVVIEPLPQQ